MDYLHELSCRDRASQIEALCIACRGALEVWKEWAGNRAIEYIDCVVGMLHLVDVTLPARALAAVEGGEDLLGIERDYVEPIVAMQDGDLDMPPEVKDAYYSIYNLVRFARGDAGSTAVLVLDQAISSRLEEADATDLLRSWWREVTRLP
jgi:hypothetical protein